jgi:hypothetical protein
MHERGMGGLSKTTRRRCSTTKRQLKKRCTMRTATLVIFMF